MGIRGHNRDFSRTRTAIIQSSCASYWRETESRTLAGAIVVKMVVRPHSRPVWRVSAQVSSLPRSQGGLVRRGNSHH
jgi:hypothetical protein